MELGQNRVWDYVGDNFVHRLVQTDSSDGKLGMISNDISIITIFGHTHFHQIKSPSFVFNIYL